MANRYKVLRAPEGWPKKLSFRLGVPGDDKDYGIGDEFEHEFIHDEEAANLASGLLEIVPREYRVVAPDSVVHDTPTGGIFVAALPVGNEALLIEGGHIERVEEPAEPKRAKPAKKKKEAKG